MTIIAYRDGVAAADSILSYPDFGMCYGETDKIIEVNGWIVGASGDFAEMRRFQKWVGGSLHKPDFSKIDGLVVRPDGRIFHFFGSQHPVEVKAPFGHAIGSGCDTAIAAMMAGADAVKAVDIAAELDDGCGGPIKVIRL